MSERPDGFDRIAPYYDALKRLVFGNAIHRSQAHFLQRLPQGCRLLIIGGGSGEVLSLLQNVNPLCRIWYVEASSKMLSLASSRVLPEAKHLVNFIHGT